MPKIGSGSPLFAPKHCRNEINTVELAENFAHQFPGRADRIPLLHLGVNKYTLRPNRATRKPIDDRDYNKHRLVHLHSFEFSVMISLRLGSSSFSSLLLSSSLNFVSINQLYKSKVPTVQSRRKSPTCSAKSPTLPLPLPPLHKRNATFQNMELCLNIIIIALACIPTSTGSTDGFNWNYPSSQPRFQHLHNSLLTFSNILKPIKKYFKTVNISCTNRSLLWLLMCWISSQLID